VRGLFALLGASAVAVACAGAASAHEGGAHTGFAARVSVIEPFLPGLIVTVVGGHERLSVSNLTDKRIVILGDRGEPFVRIGPGKTEVWTEPRIGANAEPPEEEGLVRNWRIRATADGEPFRIDGFLGYRPPPGAGAEEDGDEGFGLAALAVFGGIGVLLLAGLAGLHLRSRQS
jgi:hypothetical protein